MATREVILKLCVLGDASTRKLQLLKPLVFSMFDDKYITTLGTKVMKKTVLVEVELRGTATPVKCTLLIWDILGQKQYTKLHPVYYQGALGGPVVCALDRPETVASVPEWLRGFREVVGDVPVAVLADAGGAQAVEGADVAPVRAAVGERVPIHITSVEAPERTVAVASDFGDRAAVVGMLRRERSRVELVEVRGEPEDEAVRAASFFSHAALLAARKKLVRQWGIRFPAGAQSVEPAARLFVERFGAEALHTRWPRRTSARSMRPSARR